MPRLPRTLTLCLLLATTLSPYVTLAQDDPLRLLVPRADVLGSWSMTDSARIYIGEDLFSFIDGGAVLFFEYGFARVLAVEFHDEQGRTINLDIYEMNDPGAAFGIYSVRTGEQAASLALGQEGSTRPYYIMFWKGKFYVCIAASDSTPECRSALDAIGQFEDRGIADEGERPSLVKLLPQEGLLKTRYTRGYVGLSTVYAFEPASAFQASEGAVGLYDSGTVFLLHYPDQTQARFHAREIEGVFKSGSRFTVTSSEKDCLLVTDKRRQTLCVTNTGRYIVIALSPEPSTARYYFRKAVSTIGAE